jgi:hypothetical protein
MKMSTTDPREVPELKVPERATTNVKTSTTAPGRCRSWRSESAHHQHENVDDEPLEGAEAEGSGVSIINVKTSTAGPWEVLELEVQERPPST